MKIRELFEDPTEEVGSLRSALAVRQGQVKKTGSSKELPLAVIKDIARDLGFSITDLDTLKAFKDKIDPTDDVFDITDKGTIILNKPQAAMLPVKGDGPSLDAMAARNAKTLSSKI
jgi:hypothetical protein